mgnify:CR=1 FL=1
MMMGYAGMGMAVPWLFGAIAIVLMWAVVWWMVSSIGNTTARERTRVAPARPSLPAPRWQQPEFGRAEPAEPPSGERAARPLNELR